MMGWRGRRRQGDFKRPPKDGDRLANIVTALQASQALSYHRHCLSTCISRDIKSLIYDADAERCDEMQLMIYEA
jgi:hypothetical protein